MLKELVSLQLHEKREPRKLEEQQEGQQGGGLGFFGVADLQLEADVWREDQGEPGFLICEKGEPRQRGLAEGVAPKKQR